MPVDRDDAGRSLGPRPPRPRLQWTGPEPGPRLRASPIRRSTATEAATRPALRAAAEAALDRLHPGGPLGLALSGGGDSTALLILAAGWARARGVALHAATVDHGLREGAAADAAHAAALTNRLGVPCATLRWSGWNGRGNLQNAAREARASLLAGWAAERGVAAVALGHTLDDQAETVLLRLARGSGVDGLSAMAESSRRVGALWLRPLLGLRRDDLRAFLRAGGVDWREDPSNDDPRFDRVRARVALAALAPLGVDAEGLAATASRMTRARAALEEATEALAAEVAETDRFGVVRLDRARLRAAPEELALRLLATALRTASGHSWRPRFASLSLLDAALRAPPLLPPRTLHGCLVSATLDHVVICREARPAEDAAALGRLWDARWRVLSTAEGEVRALGKLGLCALSRARKLDDWTPPVDWRAAPAQARRALPALWRDGMLVAAPHAGYGDGLDVGLAAVLGREPFGRVD